MNLFQAIAQRDRGQIADLLARGADPNATNPNQQGWTPLHCAIDQLEQGGSIDVLRMLIKHGADVNQWDVSHDATPLLMACFRNNNEAVEILLNAGADPNVRGGEGDSPLRWCVEEKDSYIAELLLNAGAVNTIDEWGGPSGWTALGIAAHGLDVPMIRLLLDKGADSEALDEDGKTARDRLPPREKADAEVWDTALELLSLQTA